MNHKDNCVDINGRKCIVTHIKKVFEEIRKLDNPRDYDEYDGYESFNDLGDDESKYKFVDECPHSPRKKPNKMVEVEEVLGVGYGETFVEICIPLCPPAVEIYGCLSKEDIRFDTLAARKGKVFINGRLFKCIPYRAKHSYGNPSDCCGFGHTVRNTENAIAEVPFIICANVPGAVDGGKVVVLDYDVSAVNIPDYNCRCLIKSITEKDCISVKVKVVKPSIISIHGEHYCEY